MPIHNSIRNFNCLKCDNNLEYRLCCEDARDEYDEWYECKKCKTKYDEYKGKLEIRI